MTEVISEDTGQPVVQANQALPPEVGRAFTALEAAGEPVKSIAEMFQVSPSQVRKAIERTSDEERAAIKQYVALGLLSKCHAVSKKIVESMEKRDFNEKDEKGHYLTNMAQLGIMFGILVDKTMTLSEAAGMGSGSSLNPLGSWLMTEDKLAEATRNLAPGTRVRIAVEMERGSESKNAIPISHDVVQSERAQEISRALRGDSPELESA